jgi:hypothetical protein
MAMFPTPNLDITDYSRIMCISRADAYNFVEIVRATVQHNFDRKVGAAFSRVRLNARVPT